MHRSARLKSEAAKGLRLGSEFELALQANCFGGMICEDEVEGRPLPQRSPRPSQRQAIARPYMGSQCFDSGRRKRTLERDARLISCPRNTKLTPYGEEEWSDGC